MSDKQRIIGPCPHCETSVHLLVQQDNWYAVHECVKPLIYPKPYPGTEKKGPK